MPIIPDSEFCMGDMADAMVEQAEVAVYNRPMIINGKIVLNCGGACGVKIEVSIKTTGSGGKPEAISSLIIGVCPLRAKKN